MLEAAIENKRKKKAEENGKFVALYAYAKCLPACLFDRYEILTFLMSFFSSLKNFFHIFSKSRSTNKQISS
jgi:hypothetical protein